jgi:excisionase family DNA binding protein
MDDGCALTAKETADFFADPAWANAYPPILTVVEAAALARVPVQTVYAWSSQGHLKLCSKRVGKHLRILRDRFLRKIFNEGLYGH